MISFSSSAIREVERIRQDQAGSGKVLRLLVEAGGCSGFEYGMSFDEPKSDDHRLQSGPLEFLVDPASFEYLDGSEVHFDDGLNGKGFEVRNPNAQNTCGCGKSFN